MASSRESCESELATVLAANSQVLSMEAIDIGGDSTPCQTNLPLETVRDATTEKTALEFLAKLNARVRDFTLKALLLEAEQESLIYTLTSIKDDSKFRAMIPEEQIREIDGSIDSLTEAITHVDVKIATPRNSEQDDALHEVNTVINHVISKVELDLENAKEICRSLIESCQTPVLVESSIYGCEPDGAASRSAAAFQIFHQMIWKCTDYDRHRIVRRLKGLFNYISSLKYQVDLQRQITP